MSLNYDYIFSQIDKAKKKKPKHYVPWNRQPKKQKRRGKIKLKVLVEEYHNEDIEEIQVEKINQKLIEKEQLNHIRMKNHNQIQDKVVGNREHIQA